MDHNGPKPLEVFEPCEDCKGADVLTESGNVIRSDFNYAVNRLLKTVEIPSKEPYGQVYVNARKHAEDMEIPELHGEVADCAIKRALGVCGMTTSIQTELI